MGVLFYVGLVVAGWLSFGTFGKGRNRALQKRLGFYRDRSSPGAFLALVWLALGFAPVLITGPGLSMTQAIGALPVLYLFPALAFVAGYGAIVGRMARRDDRTARFAPGRVRSPWALAYSLLAAAFLVAMATRTARDYFGRWANAPEVRVQYEATMVAALDYLNRQGSGAAAVSTITPGRFHTPAIALLTLRNPEVVPRWFDGRQSLILPGESGATVVIPGFTPLPPLLQPFLAGATLVEELPMRPDDLDRPVRVYSLDGESVAQDLEQSMTTTTPGAPLPVRFGDHLELTGYDLPSIQVKPGGTLSLVTAWRILAPLPGASLFAQILGDGGRPIATADALGAPGEWWVAGDTLLQLHTLELPPGTTPGQYPLIAGAYVRPDGLRLSPAAGANDYFELATVTVADD